MSLIGYFVPSFYQFIFVSSILLLLGKFGWRVFELLFMSLLHFGFSKQETNPKKGLIYLYVFDRLRYAPNPSPYCIKVEAFLRANKFPHKTIFSFFERSREGLLPFIELDGEQICDSQLILFDLQKRLNLEDGLSTEDEAKMRALDRMIDSSIGISIFYIKFKTHSRDMLALYEKMLPIYFARMMYKSMKSKVYGKLTGSTMLNHTLEDVLIMLRADLQTLEAILKHGKPYLFGETLTIPDFTLFGHLCVAFYLPFRNPVQDLLNDEYPRVKEHMKRMLKMCFPEYESLPELGYIR